MICRLMPPTSADADEVAIAKTTGAFGSFTVIVLLAGDPICPASVNVRVTVHVVSGVVLAVTMIGFALASPSTKDTPVPVLLQPLPVTEKFTFAGPAEPLLRSTRMVEADVVSPAVKVFGAESVKVPGEELPPPHWTVMLPFGATDMVENVQLFDVVPLRVIVWAAAPVTVKAAIAPSVAAVRRRNVVIDIVRSP